MYYPCSQSAAGSFLLVISVNMDYNLIVRGESMNKKQMIEQLEEHPIVAAIKNDAQLEKCIKSDCKIVFVLYGSINTISDITARLKAAGKKAFVHIDLIDGLSPREATVEFVAKEVCPDGIISTKLPLIKCARAYNLITVMRIFMIDSMAMASVERFYKEDCVDFIEILPGLMPKIIKAIKKKTKKPIIAGGLISDKDDIVTALGAEAIAISSTNESVWFM